MRTKLRQRLTYANVMSTLARLHRARRLLVRGAHDQRQRASSDRSIPAKKLKRNSITGKEVRESRLTGAAGEDTPTGSAASPPPSSGSTARRHVPDRRRLRRTNAAAASSYGSAVLQCSQVGTPAGPGRRLPTHGELMAALGAVPLAPGGELTSDVYPSSTDPGRLDVLSSTDQVGGVALTPDTAAGGKAYRCVTDPLN